MSSFWKLLWEQPIRGVLRRPSELSQVTGQVPNSVASWLRLQRQPACYSQESCGQGCGNTPNHWRSHVQSGPEREAGLFWQRPQLRMAGGN
jgi:hypothetical protein